MTMLSNRVGSTTALAPPKRALERLATGRRLVHFRDDPAGFALASGLDVRVRSRKVAARNIEDALTATEHLDTALDEITNHLVRMREITLLSLNETITIEVRLDELLTEYSQRRSEIDRLATVTRPVASGNVTLQTGFSLPYGVGIEADADSLVTLTVPPVFSHTIRSGGIHLGNTWIGLPSFSRTALEVIDSGIQYVNQTRATIGAFQNRLTHALAVNDDTRIQLEVAHGTLADADMAGENVNVIRSMAQRDTAVGLRALVANLDRNAVSQLL